MDFIGIKGREDWVFVCVCVVSVIIFWVCIVDM